MLPRHYIDILQSKRLTLVLRILLGGTLFVFGANKLPDLEGFADFVVRWQVLPGFLAVPYGYVFPWAEVVVGLFLILALGLRFVVPIAILITATLIAGTTGTLYLLGIRGPCGCLSGFDQDLGISHIVVQVVMLIMGTQIWLQKG
jgi:thiosulfate dehydrogenase [quinone] large subunit